MYNMMLNHTSTSSSLKSEFIWMHVIAIGQQVVEYTLRSPPVGCNDDAVRGPREEE